MPSETLYSIPPSNQHTLPDRHPQRPRTVIQTFTGISPEESAPSAESTPPSSPDPPIPKHKFGKPGVRLGPTMAHSTGLCEYTIGYIQRLDILKPISDDESAHILQIDSRDNLLLHLEHILEAQSADGTEEPVEEFVAFVQTIARADWQRLPCLSQPLHTATHIKVLKHLLCIGARQYGGKEHSGFRFFVAILAWDAIITDLRTLAPNKSPSPKKIFVTRDGVRGLLDTDTLPRLLPQRSANPEASATLEKIDASMRDLFVSGELEKIAVTITEYGFGPLLTVPVIVMWASHLPECFNNLSTPVILRRYNISLSSEGKTSPSMSINIPPAPPLPPSASPAAPSSLQKANLPKPNGSPARDRALSDIYRDATDSVGRSMRLNYFLFLEAPVDDIPGVLLRHGSNISSARGEERGSLGVFLAPCSAPMDCHFLSAQHVFSEPPGSLVQTPSHLDTLRKLANIVRAPYTTSEQETECDLVQQKVDSDVATLIQSSIGVDNSSKGWRKDWAVCRVRNKHFDGRAEVNGDFTMKQADAMRLVLGLKHNYPIQGGMGVTEAVAGDTVFKVGAATGTTSGTVNETDVYYYQRGTANPADENDNSTPYDRTVLCPILQHLPSKTPFCGRGDSGAGVFACKEGRLFWVGLLVAREEAEESKAGDAISHTEFGFMVPQDIVLSQIEEETGTEWGLYDAPGKV